MKLSDYANPPAERRGVSICLHGPSGSGKSQSLATIPVNDTLILVDSEDGLRTTAPKLLAAGRNDERTHLRTATTPEEVVAILQRIRGALATMPGRVWVVVDSVSQPLHALLREATGQHGLQVYGRVSATHAAMTAELGALAHAGAIAVGVYYSGGVEYADGERMGPQIPGSKSHVVPHSYDVVLHVEGRGDDDGVFSQVAYCRQTLTVQARDRTDRLPPSLPALDWSRIAAILLDGEHAHAPAPTPALSPAVAPAAVEAPTVAAAALPADEEW
jgi:hypothetical protein